MVLTRYGHLILYKVYADLRQEAERTYIGYLWWVLEPIMFMAVFYGIFAVFLNSGDKHFVPFLLIGLTTWRWFQTSLVQGGNAIIGNKGLIQQVYVPKVVFPTVAVLTNTFKFLAVFFLLLGFLWSQGFRPNVAYCSLIGLVATELLVITAVTYLLAAIMPFIPDLRFVLDDVLRAVFFFSGIFFSASSIPETLRPYFYLNPMATLINAFRGVLMHGTWPDGFGLLLIAFVSIVGILAGLTLLQKYEYHYAKLAV